MKLTPWFGCSTRPIRPGVYERRHKKLWFKVYAKWDGQKWFLGNPSPAVAEEEKVFSKHQDGYVWRGVMK